MSTTSNTAFVREGLLDQLPAPKSEVGILGWCRQNLFSTPANAVLTIVTLLLIAFLLSGLFAWMIAPTWNASSLTECREILGALGREGHFSGACWGIIRDRWEQLLFGFYPADGYWRILLAFFLMLVALAPVLFNSLPRKMLWFSAIFPFFFPWLLWGGNILLPILVVAGFVVGYLVYRFSLASVGALMAPILGVLATIFWMIFAVGTINGWHNTVVSNIRGESSAAAMSEKLAELEAPIAAAEARIAELDGLIKAADATKKEQFVDPVHTLNEQLQANAAAREAANPTEENTGIGGRIARLIGLVTGIVTGFIPDTVEPEDVTLIADRAALSEGLKAHIADNLPLREEMVAQTLELSRLNTERKDADNIVKGVARLPDLRERLSASTDDDARKSLTTQVENIEADVGRIGLKPVASDKFGGFALSIIIGVAGILMSLPLGILLALGRQSNLLIVRTICVGFIEFIRGVPLITLLFVANTLLNFFLPPGTSFDIILRVVIMVTLFASAYMAEVIRGGLAALPKGQYEAADSLGLDYWKAQQLIIMPQALKISIPAIVSTFIGLFKDTTLVSIIGLLDPLGFSTTIRADAAWNGVVWELYAFIAILFFIFCFSMSRYSMFLERKLQTGHR